MKCFYAIVNKVNLMTTPHIIEFDKDGYAYCIDGCIAHNIGYVICDSSCKCHCHTGISKIRYCLGDNIAYCMECNKPFHTHDTLHKEQRCLKFAQQRKATYGNLMYLKNGLSWKKYLVECDVLDCTNVLEVSYIRGDRACDYGKWVCKDHQDFEFDELEYKPTP